jgi:hypothetical protein
MEHGVQQCDQRLHVRATACARSGLQSVDFHVPESSQWPTRHLLSVLPIGAWSWFTLWDNRQAGMPRVLAANLSRDAGFQGIQRLLSGRDQPPGNNWKAGREAPKHHMYGSAIPPLPLSSPSNCSLSAPPGVVRPPARVCRSDGRPAQPVTGRRRVGRVLGGTNGRPMEVAARRVGAPRRHTTTRGAHPVADLADPFIPRGDPPRPGGRGPGGGAARRHRRPGRQQLEGSCPVGHVQTTCMPCNVSGPAFQLFPASGC